MLEDRIVTVVGASGTLGGDIVQALIAKGAKVRAIVRASSNRARLEALGVTDFVVADLNDPASLQQALTKEPRAAAIVSSAAGFTAHTARTKGDNSRTDGEGYRNLVDAAKSAGIPRFIFISILGCDRARGVPHFWPKFETEQYLAAQGQPYLALRAGAFLDRSRDTVHAAVQKGEFPDIVPGVPMALTYGRDLARYAAQAALDLPVSALNQSVDIGCDVPATGEMVAAAFSRVLGRPIKAKAVFPPIIFAIAPMLSPFIPRLGANLAVLKWLREGGYVSREPLKQKELFGELPTIDESVARYCRDKALA